MTGMTAFRQVKYHAACWNCHGCGCSLVGVGRKAEAGAVYCNRCWTEGFAPDCAHCAKKVAAGGIRLASGAIFHKECRATAKSTPENPPAPGVTLNTAAARRSRAPQGFLKQLEGQPAARQGAHAHTQSTRSRRPGGPGGAGGAAGASRAKSRAKPKPKPNNMVTLDGARHKMESVGTLYSDLA